MPFWKMLKEGYDHFEVTRLEPKVDVCEKRYVFNAGQPEGATTPLNFSPRAQCPVYEVPSEIASAVAEKKKKDETAVAELISRGTPTAPVKMATDGGMHEVFATALQGGRTVQGLDGDVQRVATATPGTIPAHVNPPSNVLVASAPAAPTTVVATPAPAPAVTQPAAPPRSVARAPAQPAPRPAQAASAQPTQTASGSVPGVEATRNFLNNLFTSKGGQTQTASTAPSAPAQAAKTVDLRGTTTAARPAVAQPAAVAKPKPTAVAEAKPMPLPEPEEAAASRANAGAIRPQSSPVSAFNGAPVASSGLLSGAAPVVPSGSFGGSWR